MTIPRYANREELESALYKISSGMAVTRGAFLFTADCSVDDLDWNHLDWDHRPEIHGTYQNSVRLYADDTTAVSLTQIKFLLFRFFVCLTDIKIHRGLFYQIYTLMGFFYIHGILENTPKSTTFSWIILSHRWLKPFHKIIDRQIMKMNELQIHEDVPLRRRRTELRLQGYRFGEDTRTYLTANDKKMRTEYPRLAGRTPVDLSGYGEDEVFTFTHGAAGFIARKTKEAGLELWPQVCPHEGGPLDKKNCDKGIITCRWHGYKIRPAVISAETSDVFGARFQLNGNVLVVSEMAGNGGN